MVSINKIMSVPVTKVQTNAVPSVIKKAAPIAGGLAVLAGAGMSGVDELSHISVAPLPPGADVYNDPILDQVAYRASQISDVGANLIEGTSEMVHGAAHIVSTVGEAALDGADFALDCACTAVFKPIEAIIDVIA